MIGTRIKKHQPCFTKEVTNSYLYLNFMNANLKRICENDKIRMYSFDKIKMYK